MEKIIDLRVALRQHRGAIVRIARIENVSTNWVMRVLNGQENSEKVIRTSLDVLQQMREEALEKEAERNALFARVEFATALGQIARCGCPLN